MAILYLQEIEYFEDAITAFSYSKPVNADCFQEELIHQKLLESFSKTLKLRNVLHREIFLTFCVLIHKLYAHITD